jgi:hypothetical protein
MNAFTERTQDGDNPAAIQPEVVAAKIAAINNFEQSKLMDEVAAQPRLIELLWFIQFMSMQPGGLKKFVSDLIEAMPERLGTATMRAHRPKQGKLLSKELCLRVYKEMPYSVRDELIEYAITLEDERNVQFEKELAKRNYPYLLEVCRATCLEKLPAFLWALCNEVSKPFSAAGEIDYADIPHLRPEVWYFHDLTGALMATMDRRAETIKTRLALTAVARAVFDALDYAQSERCMVHVSGDPRFGKTEVVETFCSMWPGRARLVTVPCSDSDTDLYKAIAEALGINFNHRVKRLDLKARVEYVLRHGGLFLIFDEAAFLLPQRFSQTTPPMRLNWVRQQIVDRKLPFAMVTTPQTYQHALTKFVKKTGYRIEQFVGRNLLTVNLPMDLSHADLIAVAKIHFPELDSDYLDLIAGKAMQSESYLKAVEAIAKRARYLARANRHRAITMGDLDAAINDVMPARPQIESVEEPPRKRRAAPLQSPLKVDAERGPHRAGSGSRFASEQVALSAA